MKKTDTRSWVEINTSAIKNNYSAFRKLIGKRKLLAVVKSNAYGHDLFQFSRLMEKLGTDWLGVDVISEAVKLREAGIKKPILVLGYTPAEYFETAREHNISLTISTLENLKAAKPRLKIHLKIDTGMHRQGLAPENVLKAINLIKDSGAELEGIYTHFADAANPASGETKKQIANFQKALSVINEEGLKLIKHAAATAGTLAFPEARLDMVRIGIGLYGLWPSQMVKERFSKETNLKPALTWKTSVSEVKTLSEETGIGYSFTEKVPTDTIIGICPVGYWHGYPIQLSQKAHVMVKGKKAKIIGRVSMNMIIINLSSTGAGVGDEVILVGREIPAEELAKIAGSINYEIITRINPEIERRYI